MPPVAGQTHDLVINGEGFMLVENNKGGITYKRRAVGPAVVGLSPATGSNYESLGGGVQQPVKCFRRAIWSKWSGLGQGMVAGGDGWEKAQTAGRVYDLVSLRPVQNGGALALTPQGVSSQIDVSPFSLANVNCVTLAGITIISFDTKIYRSQNPGTNNSGFALLATTGAAITGMTIWQNQVLVSVNGTLNTLNINTGVLTAFSPASTLHMLISYQGVLVGVSVNALWFLIAGVWVAGPGLENAVTAMEELNGSLYIGTQTVLYRLDGALQPKSPATAPNILDYFNYKISIVWRTSYQVINYWPESNFSQMVAWKGYLWFFANNRLYRSAPVQGHDTMQPEPQPIVGLSLGIRVCGNLLVIITRLVNGGVCTIWANDGNYDMGAGLGWFKLAVNGQWLFPFPNAAYASGMVNVANNLGGNASITRYPVDPVSPVGWNATNYGIARTAVTGKVVLPLITPEDLVDLAGAASGKVLAVNLRRVGVEWSLIDSGSWWPSIPPDAATLTSFGLVIETSNNSGVTWTTLLEPTTGAISMSPAIFYGNRIELPVGNDLFAGGKMYPAAPPAVNTGLFPVPDSGWLIRVSWGGLVMPLLRRVWLDYDVAEVAPWTGQVWEFDIKLSDPLIGLDGGVDISAALMKVNFLRNLASEGTSFPFQDLDGITFPVKLTGLEVRRGAPGQLPAVAPGWQATVKLEEVWTGN